MTTMEDSVEPQTTLGKELQEVVKQRRLSMVRNMSLRTSIYYFKYLIVRFRYDSHRMHEMDDRDVTECNPDGEPTEGRRNLCKEGRISHR